MIWNTHNIIGLVIAIALLTYLVTKQSKAFLGVSTAYFMLCGLLVFYNPFYAHIYGVDAPLVQQLYINWTSAQAFTSFAVMTVLLFAFHHFKRHQLPAFRLVMTIVAVNSLASLVFRGALFHANSLDASVAAICLPLTMIESLGSRALRALWALNFSLVIWFSGGTAGLLAFGVTGIAVIVTQIPRRDRWAAAGVLLVGTIAPLVYFRDELTQDWGRFAAWRLFMSWWYEHARLLIGTGLGTFEAFSANIQGQTHDVWASMHNEYLQILFETGIVGLGTALMALGLALFRSYRRNRPLVTIALLNVMVVSSIQFPLRFFLSQLVIGLLFVLAIQEGRH